MDRALRARASLRRPCGTAAEGAPLRSCPPPSGQGSGHRRRPGLAAYGLKLGRAKVGPPESVDDVVPERWVELLEGAHDSNATSSTGGAAAVARSAGVISRGSRVGA